MITARPLLTVFAVLLCIIGVRYCYRTGIPVGILTENEDDPASVTIIRYALSLVEKNDWPREYFFKILTESVPANDAVQLDRAVCNLLKQGVHAIISKTNIRSYQQLVSYSNEFEVPLLSPAFPDVPPDLRSLYGISTQPNTVRAILDLLRFYSWQDIVYLYDEETGPEKLQLIFQLGYRVFKINLLGVLKVSHAEQANRYLRKLESVKKHRIFHVMLDLDTSLAKNIIVRHVHDVHVGKLNFHFIVAQPILEEFWTSQAAEFGTVNVTGFSILSSVTVKTFLTTWNQLPTETWKGAGSNLDISAYFFHDAAKVLAEGLKKILKSGRLAAVRPDPETLQRERTRDCLQTSALPMPQGRLLAQYMKQNILRETLSGKIQFDNYGMRKDFQVDIIQSSRQGHKQIGFWSDTQGIRQGSNYNSKLPVALPRTDSRRRYTVTSILSPPFLMLRSEENASGLVGNDKFEGFCKDLMDMLANATKFEYQFIISEEGTQGEYDESKGIWTGMIGDIIRGKANIAIADLQITARRRKVVDFVKEPISMASVSLLMKNPRTVSLTARSTFFILSAFSKAIWICIFISAVLLIVSFYFMSKFTGSPDNIEATSGIWGKKFTVVSSAWFTIGSSLMHGTGIYPRSISCRILGGTWWCFTLAMLAFFLSSITTQIYIDNMDTEHSPQLTRLSSLSLDTIIKESVTNNWPRLGILRKGSTYQFIQKSSLPLFTELASYLRNYPDLLYDDLNDGIKKVKESTGSYALLMESSKSEYYSKEGGCDTVFIHDVLPYAEYGIAVPLGSPLKYDLTAALRNIKERGELSHLRRKWWIEELSCDSKNLKNYGPESLKSISGIFYITLVGLIITAIVAALQYLWKAHKKEERRQRLSFEEVTMNQSLPLPPPELLMEPSMDEDNGVIDGWAERKLVPTSFRQESHRAMHDASSSH